MSKKKDDPEIIKVGDFIEKMEWEGGVEGVLAYYGEDELNTIEDKELARLAIEARRALAAFDAYIERLQDGLEEGEDGEGEEGDDEDDEENEDD